jgi:succinate dehydrogenase/fumarate reductase-like Fe-S protein
VLNAIALPLAGRRVVFLYRLITSGQPAPDRVENVTKRTGSALGNQLVEVLGQRKLLKWSIPGAAHAAVMYAFLILATVYVEAYGVLLSRDPKWHLLFIGQWGPLGYLQDLIAVLALVGLVVFSIIRFKNTPKKLGRRSRFSGSHLGGAWVVLIMIFNVIWTMLLFRGASEALGNLRYGKWAFASYAVGKLFGGPTDSHAIEVVEHIGLLLHIGVMLVFLIIVLNSKHLHIFIAPLNVMFKRPGSTDALGPVKQMMSEGKPLTLDDVDEMDEDTTLGIGSIQDFSWKGLLDMASCTECGRCQSQCPAWNTEKPLSPKMLIMNLRDHAFASAPYLLADSDEKRAALPEAVIAEAGRPLVGATEGEPWHPTGGAVIDDDVLWSCTNCGACVNQCPVDIEHVDHIIDMRRYQVLVESNFPAELNGLFKGLENKGNPWNMNPNARMEWAQGLPFDVKVIGDDVADLD